MKDCIIIDGEEFLKKKIEVTIVTELLIDKHGIAIGVDKVREACADKIRRGMCGSSGYMYSYDVTSEDTIVKSKFI